MLHVEGQISEITYQFNRESGGTTLKCFGSDAVFRGMSGIFPALRLAQIAHMQVEPSGPNEFTVHKCEVEGEVIYDAAPLFVDENHELLCTSDVDSLAFRDALQSVREIELALIAYLL